MGTQSTDKRGYVSLVVLILLLASFGCYSIFKAVSLAEQTSLLYRHPFTVGTNVRDIYSSVLAIHRNMKDVAVAKNYDEIEAVVPDVDVADHEVIKKLAILNDRYLGDMDDIRKFAKDFEDWRGIRNQVIEHAENGKTDLAIAITQGKGREHVELLLEELRKIINFANSKADEFRDKAEYESRRAIWSIAILLLLSVIASSVIAFYLISSISQRRQQMRQLLKSKENLGTTIRCIGDGVIITDMQGVVQQMNPVAEILTGWNLNDAIGQNLDTVFRIINEDSRLRVENPVEKVLREGGVVGMANHTLLISRDGREVPIADSAAPIRTSEDENAFGIVLVFRNQMDERRAEMQINHLNQVLRSIRDVSQLITRCKDQRDLLQGACDCLTSTRGYNYVWIAALDIQQKPLVFCQSGGDGKFSYFSDCIQKEAYPECVRNALERQDVCLIEDIHRNCKECEFAHLKDRYKALVVSLRYGEKLYGVMFAHMPSPISPSEEEQSLFGEVGSDIAYALHVLEQENIHRGVQRKVDKQQQLLDLTGYMAKVGGWEYNIQTSEFTFTSETARIHGRKPTDKLTLDEILNAYTGDSHDALKKSIDMAVADSQAFDIELILEFADEAAVNVRATGQAVIEAGDVRWITGTFQDITERSNFEARLRQKEKMEAVGQLAGGIAHDFNNQLACIVGYSELLANTLKDKDHITYARNIFNAANHSAELTRQLLAYSRKGKFLSQPLNLHGVVDEVVSFVEHSFDKRIVVEKQLHADNSVILGDPSQLQNSILNLALNARDAMPEGGTLCFSTRLIELKEKAFDFEISEGEYIELAVSDTGIGISKNNLVHIYEPFYTTKEQGKGTGLGLASVFGAVKSHQGAMSVYSEVGQGTVFKLYFPVIRKKTEVTNLIINTDVGVIHNARVMVVDDEPLVCDLLTGMLRQIGYKVIPFTDPQKALAFYANSHKDINLVVLDMVMPKISGKDLFVSMKKINKDIIAVLASGYSINNDVKSILDHGVVDFIQKPFQMNEIAEVVYRALVAHK